MAQKIQVRRGLAADLPTLDLGELGFTLDTNAVYIGSTIGNLQVTAGAGGGITAAANIGTGAGVFASVSGGNTLQFKSIALGSSGLMSLAVTANTLTIDTSAQANTGANVGGGTGIYSAMSGSVLQFNTLAAGTGITITPSGNLITIAGNSGTITGGTNLGAGGTGTGQIYVSASGANLQFKEIAAGTSGNVTVTQTGTDIIIDVPTIGQSNVGANLGAGTALYAGNSGVALQFKSLVAGTGVSLSNDANTVTIANGGVTGLNSLTGTVTLAAGSNISLGTVGNTITINGTGSGGGTITGGVNLGTGTGVFTTVNGSNMQFNSLVAGSGISITPSGGNITIASTVASGVSSLNSLTGALSLLNGSGITITPSGSTITVANSGVTGINSIAGAITLAAGTNITLGTVGNTITINSTASGGGITSLNGLTSAVQTFANDTNVTITSASSTHTIGWSGTLAPARGGTGANLSLVNGGIIYSTASALAVGPVGSAGQVLSSNGGSSSPSWMTLSGSNLGSGAGQVFSGYSAGAFSFRNLLAGSGITISENSTDITIAATAGGGGTVTSVALTMPGIFTVSGSPVTTSGTLAATLTTQAANTIFAGPGTGPTATPSFRTMVLADLPSIGSNTLLANNTGSSATPVAATISAVMDAGLGSIQGDIAYRSASGWTVLPPGTSGQFLQTGGSGANPSWATGGSSGVSSINSVTGAAVLVGGTGVSVSPSGQNINIVNTGVTAVNSLTGGVTLAAGTGVTITPGGNTLTISASGGGGANTSLSNLVSPAVNVTLLPQTNLLQQLGNASFAWGGVTANGFIFADATGHTMTMVAPNTITTYSVTMPAAQGTGALTNDGSGNLSWTPGGSSGVSSLNALTGAVTISAGTNVTLGGSGNNIIINATAGGGGVSSLNSLTGALSITAGTGVSVTPSGSSIAVANTGVLSMTVLGTPLTGALTLTAGTGISFGTVGNNVTINATGGGSGTVTSVAMTVPTFLSVSGSPVTSSGTLAVSLATQSANQIFAGPTTGSAAAPTFRSLVLGDLPAIGTNTVLANITGSSAVPTASSLSAIIDASIGSTQGDVLYRSASGWSVLAPGTSGQFLQTSGTGANPVWATASGGGGAAPVLRQFNSTGSSTDVVVTIIAVGTSGQISAITATTSGTTLTLGNIASGVFLISVELILTAADVTGTAYSLIYPDPNGATSLATATFPMAAKYSPAYAYTAATFAPAPSISGSNITLSVSGLTASSGPWTLKFVF